MKVSKICSFIGVFIVILIANKSTIRISESSILHMFTEIFSTIMIIILLLLECWITYNFVPFVNSLLLARIRYIITVMIIFSASLSVLLAIWSFIAFKKDFQQFNYRINWKLLEGGYIPHILSAISQWISVLLLSPFIASYVFDMKRIQFIDKQFSFEFIKVDSVNRNI